MICLLLIMTMIFVNGIENTELKGRRSDTVLREEEMNEKTKAWLLMVESGKVDEEELRRITPKSIFIAPLLTGRTGKCKEGYRHDHLGQCVKVIKIDPKVQLELLLERLNKLYTEKKQEEERLPEMSSGPLHFSIPISNENDTGIKTTSEDPKSETNSTSSGSQGFPEFIPIPLPFALANQTKETKEIESSGGGPLNDTETLTDSHLEGSGFEPEEIPLDGDTTPISFLSEDTDYIDARESESTTEIPPTTETQSTTTEILSTTETIPTVTEFPLAEETNSTESYQSITDAISVNDSVVDYSNETVHTPDVVINKTKSDIIVFPRDEERTHVDQSSDTSYIRFPDDPPEPQHPGYHPLQHPPPQWNSQFQLLPSAIPRQQFWWLPENWKVDESQQKSTLVKFWSRLPLMHDVSFVGEGKENFKRPPLIPNQPQPQPQHQPQVFHLQGRTNEFLTNFNHNPTPIRRGKPFRSNRLYQDIVVTPRQNHRLHR